ncbi:hypothetical protein [Dyadobacter luticola]|uniref:DoxX family protein n=1 Tax=Dyadobacter luticola TaxID=1979387 RepID=A0A5R9L6H0_9BACT|nr:hypothetical protein [Dyadobacter luticola]TLV03937.1 hypothetical protein FEN17_10235 [Dyadobacter luticola]
MKIISGILILITAFLSLKHGWEGLQIDSHPEQLKMATDLGVGKTGVMVVSVLSLAVGIAILFPQTFFIANLVNAITIVLIMAFSLKGGNYKMALMEIPFLAIPLVLIYLGHPLKK